MPAIKTAARMIVLLVTVVGVSASTWAFVRTHDPLPDFDAAGGIRHGLPSGVSVTAAQQSMLLGLERRIGVELRATYNGLTGTPRTLGARRPLSPPSTENPEVIAREFMRANRAIWEFTDEDLSGLKSDAQYTDRHNGVTHVYLRQTEGGIPLFFGVISVNISSKGEVLSVQGDAFPGAQVAAPARLTPEEAAEAAARHIGVTYSAKRTGAQNDAVLLAQEGLMSPVRVTRTIYALLGAPRLAYRMVLEKNGLEWYDILVDAATGEILHRRNLYQFAGLIAPSAPVEPNPATPRGLVYVEHPLATIRGTGDLFRKYPFTVDPTGRPRGFANAPVNMAESIPVNTHGPNPVNATIDQILMPMPDASSPLRSTALPLGSSPQSPSGWFIPEGGNYLSIGNNVDAKEDHSANNEVTIGLRANGGATGDFSGPSFVYQNNFGQNGPYANAAARSTGGLPDVPAAVLTLFYVNNWYHDLLYHLGFTEAAGNFQMDNFGRGGLGNDFVFADAQDGSGSDNANFGTPVDGSNPRMQMFFWTGPDRDAALDFDVIIHEYSHGLSNRLVGGPNNVNCLGQVGATGEGGGMGEGWGDWFAITLSDEPSLSEYSGGNANGIRTNPVGTRRTDYSYGLLCTGPPSNPNPLGCEVHGAGEFWTIVLWEMREAMINRFHNRAFPAGPTFPTFTGTGSPAGNVFVAEGRSFDGSNTAAQIDHASIESAAFAAMFRVVDAMKLSVCNPTMVTMRDSILEADRNMGGEFQDVIWRVFANRGLGLLAQSSNSEVPTPVESFLVPATVESCESAGGPTGAPGFTATSTSPNTVTIDITPNGAVEYIIMRGTAESTAVEPEPFVEVGRTTGTSFTDAGVDGGFTYYYRVHGARNDDCISAGNSVSVVPMGGPLPCLIDPTFFGLAHVTVPGDCERLVLDWSPAASNCPAAGPDVTYNVYRAASPTFTPSASNRIATGVAGNSFVDTPGELDSLFYYIVRAEDSSTGGGGPANGGNEDDNPTALPGLVTSASLLNQGFSDDVESGPDNGSSLHFTSSGMIVQGIPQRGGWFRDGNPTPAAAHSPTNVWHAFNPDNESLSTLTSDIITITPSSILGFYHTFATESGFDGGVVEYALVDPSGTPGPFQDMGDLIYENRYTGLLLSAPDNTNVLGGRRAYTGGIIGSMTRVRAFLGGLVPSGMPSQRIQIRFVFASDVAQSLPPPTNTVGRFLPGWYIDDITIDESCCPISPAPTNLIAIAGNGQVTLTWNPPAGGAVSQYLVFRELVAGTIPSTFDDRIATVPGTQNFFVDADVAPDVNYAYVVRAAPASGCPSGDSNVATATPFGVCRLAPTFAGLDRIQAIPQAICALTLSWLEGTGNCPGETVRYNVYRSTDPSFTPSLANAIALGLTGLSYLDQTGLASGVTHYYVVRAEDSTANGTGPANSGNEDANLVRLPGSPQGALEPGPDFVDDLEPVPLPGYTTFTTRQPGWAATTDPSAHSLSSSWFVPDMDQNRGTAPHRDARLTLPSVNLTSSSTMTFWHNFDFARFPTAAAATRYRSGGVLEISADGVTWFDLGPHITMNGYNGTVFSGTVGGPSPLDGRAAWVGATAGDNVTGRADPMRQVSVDLGAAIQDPSIFGVTVLPGASIRFRMGGTYVILSNGIQGVGWGVDDITLTGLQQAGSCTTGGSCVTDPFFSGLGTVEGSVQSTCSTNLTWSAAFPNCPGATVRYNVYRSTDATFVPAPANAVALGVSGLAYTDQDDLISGVTYYYIVRSEDSTTGGLGPANGGNEDDNLVRLGAVPRGPLTVGPDFSDDLEPAPEPGYTTSSTRDVGGWAITDDPTANSQDQAWVVLDLQPSVPPSTPADDSLTLPALNLTLSSVMTFYHNFDFARFLTGGDTQFQSGGVLEISADGITWKDLEPFITGGGYNGTVAAAALNPLAGRRAWVGSSDGGAGNPVATRSDPMTQVVVDLGAAISDPDMFNTPTLPRALVRFRMGGTFQVLLDGTRGVGWGVDGISVSGVQSPGTCGPLCTTDPVFAGVGVVSAPLSASCSLAVIWNPAAVGCPGALLRYNIYRSTDPSFTPSAGNAIALGVVGSTYLDESNLVSGTTYYYIVRSEDSTTGGGGPANGGNEDNNLRRASASPRGVLEPGPDFVDDLEPAAAAGYGTATTRQPGWEVIDDPTAHSLTHSWFVPDLDQNRGFPPHRDATLTLPALNLTSASILTFWHNFDFARFPTAAVATRYKSGGVLEISTSGITWIDLGPYITMNGYNGTVSAATVGGPTALDGRNAWVGSTDGDNVAGRADLMRQVSVNLGAAIQALFSVTELPGALVRFRMGGTYVILTNGIQGDGWGVDDISVTNVLSPGACVTAQPAGLVDQLTVRRAAGGDITLSWTPSCAQGDFDYEIYEGSLASFYSHSSRFCSTGGETSRTFTPDPGNSYYLVVARNGVNEGSYGQASNGNERPAAPSACLAQKIGSCP